jgi:hypothetical protein
LASLDSFDSLPVRYLGLQEYEKRYQSRRLAERRIPMPVKITAAGGNG